MATPVIPKKQFKGGSMAETHLIKRGENLKVRKIAEKGNGLGFNKLYEQWIWLYLFNMKHPKIFPDVDFFISTKQAGYYDMDYLETEELLVDTVISSKITEELVHKVLGTGAIITDFKIENGEYQKQYIRKKHLKKMIERCRVISSYDFYNEDYISINGKMYKNLHLLIEEIMSDEKIMKLLEPKEFVGSHGDFTLQNLMTDGNTIYAIDPRGSASDSVYYDISKLYQSLHGKYDLIYKGNWDVNYSPSVDTGEVKIEYNIFNFTEKFDEVLKVFRKHIPQYYDLQEKEWETITKFYEASHFISMTPFRMKEGIKETLICYSIGIQILNEALEELKNETAKSN